MRKYAPLLFVTVAVFALLVPLSWLHGSSIASAIIGQNAGSTLGTISGINCNGATIWCSIQAGILQLNTGNPAVRWTVIQHTLALNCAPVTEENLNYCTVTTTPVTAGNAVIISEALLGINPVVSPTFNYVSGDNFTHCPGTQTAVQFGGDGSGNTGYWETTDCAYILSATGGGSSFTFSVNFWGNGPTYTMDVHVVEVHRSTGTAVFDTSASTTAIDCSSCIGPTVQLGGSDYVYVFAALWNTPGTISAPYTNPQDVDSNYVDAIFGGALNQTVYSVPTITQSPASAAAIGVIALK